MIDIALLTGYNKDRIKTELLKEESAKIEVYLPKSTKQFFSEREEIVDDYVLLAYSGHLLKNVSKSFEYEKIPPAHHESVQFIIEPVDLDKLAETIQEITYGYVNDQPEEDETFIGWAYDYLDNVQEGELDDVACPYFIEVALEFASDEEE